MHVAFAVPQAGESPRCQTGSLEGAFGMWQCASFPQKPRERVTGLHCFYMAPALSFPGPGFSITGIVRSKGIAYVMWQMWTVCIKDFHAAGMPIIGLLRAGGLSRSHLDDD